MSLSHAAKRNRVTWILASLLIALVSAIALIKSNETTQATLPKRAAQDVSTITITRTADPTDATSEDSSITIQRHSTNPDQWIITHPVHITANEQRITPLLTVYTNSDPGYDIGAVDLVATGLTNPEAEISFDGYLVKVGNVALEGGKRHALHGERVRFVPDWLLPFLQGGVSAFANLTVWGEGLRSITVDGVTFDELSLNQAKELTAQQFVVWPRPENPTVLVERTINVENEQSTTTWTVAQTERYVAIQPPELDYAYIVAVEEVPWLLKQ